MSSGGVGIAFLNCCFLKAEGVHDTTSGHCVVCLRWDLHMLCSGDIFWIGTSTVAV